MNHTAALHLAKPIAAYFAADALPANDRETEWFAPDAQVHDEGRTYKGVEAIGAWKAQGKAKTAYVLEPLNEAHVDGRTLVSTRVSGNFPGSPVILTYAFTLANGRIADMGIRP